MAKKRPKDTSSSTLREIARLEKKRMSLELRITELLEQLEEIEQELRNLKGDNGAA